MELRVAVAWEGKEDVPELVLDGGAVVLTIGEGTGRFVHRRSLDKGVAVTRHDASGGPLSNTVAWTPVRAGEFPIEAVFGGRAVGRTKVTVKPATNGATELGWRMATTRGDMTFRFLPEAAPNHVAHFADLVRKGFFDGLGFHRVIRGFMAQGGDPLGTGEGGPGWSIPAEFSKDPKFSHIRGRLSTARDDNPNSGGSQFFICFKEVPRLDGKYTVFGEMVEGDETLKKIEEIGAAKDPEPPKEIVRITSAKLVPLPPAKTAGKSEK